MSTYKELRGLRVKYVPTDTTSPSTAATGDVWYNTTTAQLKAYVGISAWSAGSSLTTARHFPAGAGTQTASFCVAGIVSPSSFPTSTEEYNGSGWSAGGDFPAGRWAHAACGTLTAGLSFGGAYPGYRAETYEYDGSSWTETNDLNTARYMLTGAGTQTAGLAMGASAGAHGNSTEEYNGSTWTESGALGTARYHHGGCGTQTAALVTGGATFPPRVNINATEEYDGSSWTAGENMPNSYSQHVNIGIQTAALSFGGQAAAPPTPVVNTTLTYDGTDYAAAPNMGTARNNHAGSGVQTAGLAFTGSTPSNSSATEEYNNSFQVVTAGVWTSGANYPVTIQDACGAGPGTASVVAGGYDGPAYTTLAEEYNGSAWSEGGAMNTGRACYNIGTGSQTAALVAGGYATTAHTANSEEYNGSSWTEGGNLNNSRYSGTGGGVQTSALMCGGNGDPGNSAIANTESYNGSSWTNETALPAAKGTNKMFSGTSETSNIICGFGPAGNDTISYDGSSWTDLGHHLVDSKSNMAGGSAQGSATSAIIAGGFDSSPGITTAAQQYNGSVWVTAPSLSTSRYGGACSGTYSSCLAVGGEQPAQSNHTEEWTAETTANTASTIDFD